MDEMSVLDYLKLKLKPQNWHRPILPEESEFQTTETEFDEKSLRNQTSLISTVADSIQRETVSHPFHMVNLSFAALMIATLLALVAQLFIEPMIVHNNRNYLLSVILYGFSALILLISFFVQKKSMSEEKSDWEDHIFHEKEILAASLFNETFYRYWAALSAGCAFIAFILFGNNEFNFINLTFWFFSILFAVFSLKGIPSKGAIKERLNKIGDRFNPIQIRISPWNLLCIFIFGLSIWFRFHQLDAVPGDMFSDHAEKLYDVMDVMDGKHSIFFVRNTGREAFQFYWTVLIIKLFGTGISFLSLKIGTAIASLFILPFVYRLGKAVGNRWVGLISMFLCGSAYWLNVIGRVALRFAFYPMFAVPALYFLIRGLSEKRRKDLVYSGVFLGIGLQGYSAMRIVPLVFAVIFLIYWFRLPKNARLNALKAFLILIGFTILFCLPLIRIVTISPEMVFYRTLTRLSDVETAISTSPFVIFFSNLWKALIMPFWDNGRVWVHSIPFRPALDNLTASFFFIGLILMILRIVREKRWQDVVLILSIPLLMLPSVLSIAFPDENPCLNRTGAAAIPILITAAYGIVSVWHSLISRLKGSKINVLFAAALGIVFLIFIGQNNYDLVFNEYRQNYDLNALNTRQIGQVIRGFADSVGTEDDAYVIPYPYWVDTRLVGINAGFPRKDYALSKDLIGSVVKGESPILFIYNNNDSETAATLKKLYPDGLEKLYEGKVSGKNFYGYLVP